MVVLFDNFLILWNLYLKKLSLLHLKEWKLLHQWVWLLKLILPVTPLSGNKSVMKLLMLINLSVIHCIILFQLLLVEIIVEGKTRLKIVVSTFPHIMAKKVLIGDSLPTQNYFNESVITFTMNCIFCISFVGWILIQILVWKFQYLVQMKLQLMVPVKFLIFFLPPVYVKMM